jgi:hypothetical protein
MYGSTVLLLWKSEMQFGHVSRLRFDSRGEISCKLLCFGAIDKLTYRLARGIQGLGRHDEKVSVMALSGMLIVVMLLSTLHLAC